MILQHKAEFKKRGQGTLNVDQIAQYLKEVVKGDFERQKDDPLKKAVQDGNFWLFLFLFSFSFSSSMFFPTLSLAAIGTIERLERSPKGSKDNSGDSADSDSDMSDSDSSDPELDSKTQFTHYPV